MALLHFDGFDGLAIADLGPLGGYTPTGTLTMVTGRFPSFNSQAVQTGAAANTTDGLTITHAPKAIVTYGLAVRFGSLAAAYRVLSGRNGATESFNIVRNTAGRLVIRSGTSVTDVAVGTQVLANSQWYYMEVQFNYPGSGNPTVTVRVNGSVDVTNSSTFGSVTTLDRVVAGFSFSTVQVAPSFSIDDLYILDSLGTDNNTFLGDVRVELLVPSSTSFNDGFTPTGAATNHEATDEALQDGDTTFTSATAVGRDIDFGMTDLSNTPSAIFGVAVQTVGMKTDVGIRTTTSRLKSGAATATGAAHTLTSTAYTASPLQIIERDPDGNIAWTRPKLEAAVVGVEITA